MLVVAIMMNIQSNLKITIILPTHNSIDHTRTFSISIISHDLFICANKQSFTIHMRANKIDFSRKDFFSPIWCSRNVVHGAVNNLFPLESTLLNCCWVFHFFFSLWTFDSFHWFPFAYPDLHCESWSNALVRCVRVIEWYFLSRFLWKNEKNLFPSGKNWILN